MPPLLVSRLSPKRDLVHAMHAARVIQTHTQVATSRWRHSTTLPDVLDLQNATDDDLYQAMDRLLNH